MMSSFYSRYWVDRNFCSRKNILPIPFIFCIGIWRRHGGWREPPAVQGGVSIHAPVKEATVHTRNTVQGTTCFNPRPREGGDCRTATDCCDLTFCLGFALPLPQFNTLAALYQRHIMSVLMPRQVFFQRERVWKS